MSSQDAPIQFGTADYVILALMLGGSMGIGLYMALAGKKETSQADYLLGGRRMKALPVCLSLFATFQSAISLLGTPTEIYTYGTMAIYFYVGYIFSHVVSTVTVVPMIHPLGLSSVYEYLALRYRSKTLQCLGAAMGVICSLAYMTVALLSPALALETAVGVPLWMSIFLVGAVGTVYTTLGGMKSVIWTDVFQTVVIFVGIFTVLVKGTMDAGGIDKVWQINRDSGRIQFDEVSLDPRVRHTVWNQIFGVLFFGMSIHFSQSSVQRVISTASVQDANKVHLFTLPVSALFFVVLCFTGLVIFAYFSSLGCDPLASGLIQNKNQLVPYFVLHALRFLPGLPGLYISTIFSGALSTLSSGINSISANIVQDFIAKLIRGLPERIVTTITKVLVCFLGFSIIGLAYLAKEFQGPIVQMNYTVMSATNGPLLGLFLLSGLFPQANYIGAIFGLLTSVIINSWQAMGSILFGYSTPTLSPGPVYNCPAQNTTMFNLTTLPYDITNNLATQITPSWSPNVTMSPDFSSSGSVITDGLQDRPFSFYDLSYTLNPLIGALVTVLVGLATSLIVKPCLKEDWRPASKLLFPFCRSFWYSDMEVLATEMQQELQRHFSKECL